MATNMNIANILKKVSKGAESIEKGIDLVEDVNSLISKSKNSIIPNREDTDFRNLTLDEFIVLKFEQFLALEPHAEMQTIRPVNIKSFNKDYTTSVDLTKKVIRAFKDNKLVGEFKYEQLYKPLIGSDPEVDLIEHNKIMEEQYAENFLKEDKKLLDNVFNKDNNINDIVSDIIDIKSKISSFNTEQVYLPTDDDLPENMLLPTEKSKRGRKKSIENKIDNILQENNMLSSKDLLQETKESVEVGDISFSNFCKEQEFIEAISTIAQYFRKYLDQSNRK